VGLVCSRHNRWWQVIRGDSDDGGRLATLFLSDCIHGTITKTTIKAVRVQRVGLRSTVRMVFGFLRRIKSWIVWSWTYLWAFWFLLVLFVIYYLRGPLKISENIGMGNGCTFLWQSEQVFKLATECQVN